MRDCRPSPFARARVAALCAEVIHRAGAAGVVPTPLDAVGDAIGVRDCVDIANVPLQGRAREKLLGVAWFEERMLFVDRSQRVGRRRFTEAHELAHLLCPWHEAAFRFDTSAQLFGSLGRGLEAEANFGAAQLIFQGGLFGAMASEHERSLATPFALAAEFAASRQAAAHYYVEGHRDAMAMAIAGRWPDRDGRLPVWRTVESTSFLRRFGRFSGDGLCVHDRPGSPFAAAIAAARCSAEPAADGIELRDRAGRSRRVHAEVFNNRHCHIVFVAELNRCWPPRRRSHHPPSPSGEGQMVV
jgi:uncharacterized protein DUF955